MGDLYDLHGAKRDTGLWTGEMARKGLLARCSGQTVCHSVLGSPRASQGLYDKHVAYLCRLRGCIWACGIPPPWSAAAAACVQIKVSQMPPPTSNEREWLEFPDEPLDDDDPDHNPDSGGMMSHHY